MLARSIRRAFDQTLAALDRELAAAPD
jgi:hypothetical protein